MARKRRGGAARGRGGKRGKGFTIEQLRTLGVNVDEFRKEHPLPPAIATRATLQAGPKRNKTEAAYEEWLRLQLQLGIISAYSFEPMKLRLGPDWLTSYTPDFMVVMLDGVIEMVDVKGASSSKGSTAGAWWEEDARLKIKVAAGLFPFRFVGVHEGASGWVREVFPPG